jgi:hypothetical protein
MATRADMHSTAVERAFMMADWINKHQLPFRTQLSARVLQLVSDPTSGSLPLNGIALLALLGFLTKVEISQLFKHPFFRNVLDQSRTQPGFEAFALFLTASSYKYFEFQHKMFPSLSARYTKTAFPVDAVSKARLRSWLVAAGLVPVRVFLFLLYLLVGLNNAPASLR